MQISKGNSSLNTWILAFILTLPLFVLYIFHFSVTTNKPELLPTGYIMGDMPYYMSNALEYKESPELELKYPLPFSTNYENKPVYFHPQIFVMGMILRYTSIDPMVLFLVFGFIFSVLGIRVCLKLLQSISGLRDGPFYLLSVLFIWGGGLLVVSGFLFSLLKLGSIHAALNFKKIFVLDPFEGWWFLNLGRNFIYPTEAYYHFLFFQSVYFLRLNKILPAVLVALLLSISHPFTGIAILLFVFCWLLFEKIFMRNKDISINYIILLSIGMIWFVYYNLVYLPSDPEHKILMDQWTLDWSGSYKSFLPGYILVLIPAVIRLSCKEKFNQFFKDPFNRFLLIWLFINLGLENHNHFIKPHQPLHFTRGYVWVCLFIIGLPVILEFLKKIWNLSSRFMKYSLLAVICILFLLDNATWITLQSLRQSEGGGVTLTAEQKEILNYLDANYKQKFLLVSQDKNIGYLSTVYTPYRSFYSHKHNTPHGEQSLKALKDMMNHCQLDSSLQYRNLIFVVYKDKVNCDFINDAQLLFQNKNYEIYSRMVHP